MLTSSLSPVDDNVQIPAPISVLARLLLSLSNVLGNVLAAVYTTNIYIYIYIIDFSWLYDTDYTRKRSQKVRRSTRGGFVKRSGGISVSLITLKSRWYKPGHIVATCMLFACVDSSPHTSSSPSTAFTIYSFPTALVQRGQTSHRKQLLLLLGVILVGARPL
jgi:hypothetical protein